MPRYKFSKEESDEMSRDNEAFARTLIPSNKRLEGLHPAPTKSNTKKEIKDLLKSVKETNITTKSKGHKTISKATKLVSDMLNAPKSKKTKSTKNISMAVDLVSDMLKKPKGKKVNMESIEHEINEVDKLLKASPKALKKLVKADKEHIKYHPSEMDKKELKLDTKIMKQSKGYIHKPKSISPAAQAYVNEYISIYKNNPSPPSRGRLINKLKLQDYTNLRPSDLDDVNELIGEFKKSLEPKPKVKGVTKAANPQDKKYKAVSLYVMKNKPSSITDEGDIELIISDLIDKESRMSKKLLDAVLKDLEFI